jgi:CRP-like cAMP-binding protein
MVVNRKTRLDNETSTFSPINGFDLVTKFGKNFATGGYNMELLNTNHPSSAPKYPVPKTKMLSKSSRQNQTYSSAKPDGWKLRDSQRNTTVKSSRKNYTQLNSIFDSNSFDQKFQPNSTILLHGDPADAIYMVASGTVRCCTIDAQGNRQIFRFAQKGEFLGVAAFNEWHFTAEAIDYVIVKSVARSVLERESAVNIALRDEERTHFRELLMCRENQLLSLVYKKAPQRLFEFLSAFATSRQGSGFIVLPMGRRDIADHLGLTVETVSRAFSDLKRQRIIELATSGRFRICSETGSTAQTADATWPM